jgi:cyclophilin family peptidyl-prolyl cis-trans isomerase
MKSETSGPSSSSGKQNPQSPAARLTSPASEYSVNGILVLLKTSMGDVTIQVRDDKPVTAGNFANLVKQGFYDGTVFHRVIAGFMVQGGQNPNVDAASIPDEIGADNRNVAGTIAMAKTSQPNSATSQFFINVADNGNNLIDRSGTRFDSVFTVFGRVAASMDVVLKISQVPVTRNIYGENSQPARPITITKATLIP